MRCVLCLLRRRNANEKKTVKNLNFQGATWRYKVSKSKANEAKLYLMPNDMLLLCVSSWFIVYKNRVFHFGFLRFFFVFFFSSDKKTTFITKKPSREKRNVLWCYFRVYTRDFASQKHEILISLRIVQLHKARDTFRQLSAFNPPNTVAKRTKLEIEEKRHTSFPSALTAQNPTQSRITGLHHKSR